MFTGLIETTGTVVSLSSGADSAVLTLEATFAGSAVSIGDSIAVNGICLTVVAITAGRYGFDVSPETVRCSGLAAVRPGSLVNLERAMIMGGRLDGHLVTGHIDCTARLSDKSRQGNAVILRFSLPSEHAGMLVAKGSVAIDGISLTVNQVGADFFSVSIIPHTLAKTTLSVAGVGSVVNIETDIIGKYVARLVAPQRQSGGLSRDTLASHGFI